MPPPAVAWSEPDATFAVVAFRVKLPAVTTRLACVASPTYASVSEVTVLEVDALPMPTRPPPLLVECAFVRDAEKLWIVTSPVAVTRVERT